MQRTNVTAHVIHGTRRLVNRPVNIKDDGTLWIYTAYNKAPRKLHKHKSGWMYYNRYGVLYYVKLRIKAQGRKINEAHSQA